MWHTVFWYTTIILQKIVEKLYSIFNKVFREIAQFFLAKRHFYLTLSSYFLQIKLMKNHWFSAFLKTLLGITLNISKNIFKLNFKVILIEFKILFHLIFNFSKIRSSSLLYSLKSWYNQLLLLLHLTAPIICCCVQSIVWLINLLLIL